MPTKKFKVEIEFEASADNAIVQRTQGKFVAAFSAMKAADQRRVLKIMENPKYLKGLADNEVLLEEMFA